MRDFASLTGLLTLALTASVPLSWFLVDRQIVSLELQLLIAPGTACIIGALLHGLLLRMRALPLVLTLAGVAVVLPAAAWGTIVFGSSVLSDYGRRVPFTLVPALILTAVLVAALSLCRFRPTWLGVVTVVELSLLWFNVQTIAAEISPQGWMSVVLPAVARALPLGSLDALESVVGFEMGMVPFGVPATAALVAVPIAIVFGSGASPSNGTQRTKGSSRREPASSTL